MFNIILTVVAVIVILILGARFADRFNFMPNQNQASQIIGQSASSASDLNFRNQPSLENSATISNASNTETLAPKIEILKNGSGPEIKNGDKATMNYVGTFENGKKFDSSYDRGQPFQFMLGAGQVIKGWDMGVLEMKVGEKRRLTIPYQFGYGNAGMPPVIPPKANLIFEVELLKIN